MDLIEQVEKQTTVSELLASFNDQSTSDYLVVYLRLLTSGYLQRESKFFEHFIEGGRSTKEFCQQVRHVGCRFATREGRLGPARGSCTVGLFPLGNLHELLT